MVELTDFDAILDELLGEVDPRSGGSIGPGVGSVGIELYVAATLDSRWDRAVWDGQVWDAAGWEPIECEVLECDYQSGSSQEAGVLSVASAGALDVRAYDPGRILDPIATSSPYFGAVRPGTPIRIVGKVPGRMPAWTGFLDEVRHELATSVGRLRAVDGIALVAQAELPEGTVLPNTLRARVRAILAAVGLGSLVPVQPDSGTLDLVTGGSFEDPALPGWTPINVGAGSGSFVMTGPSWLGTSALRLVGGLASPSYYQLVPVEPGLRYQLVGAVARPSGAGRFGTLAMMAVGPDGSRLAYVATATGTRDGWEPLTLPAYTVPADGSVVSLWIECSIASSTTVATDSPLFDGVGLIGPDPDKQLAADPPVAAHDGKRRSAWSVILDAGLDALVFVWLDPTGTIRFTPWGSLPDAAYAVGCTDGLGGVWLEGIAELETIGQAEAVRNAVRSWTAPDTFGALVRDDVSVAKYGERILEVPRVVPNAASWTDRILADRGDAGLEVTLGEVRPYSEGELALLLDDAMTGPSVVRVRDDSHGEVVDLSVGIIGTAVGITANGWRFRDVTMIPRAEWDEEEPPPPEPPIPPPDAWHTETRSYVATSDALIALTSGGAKYGAGAATTLPVGSWSGWQYRGLIQLPAIPWTKIRRIVSATLILRTSDANRVGFGSSPTIDVKRITGSWSAGSSSSPSGGNAVVWPGPSVTGSIRANVTKSENATVRIRVDALVLPWAPASIGGALAAQRGLALYAGSGSTADTTEFWPVEKGGSSRPSLELVVEVFD